MVQHRSNTMNTSDPQSLRQKCVSNYTIYDMILQDEKLKLLSQRRRFERKKNRLGARSVAPILAFKTGVQTMGAHRRAKLSQSQQNWPGRKPTRMSTPVPRLLTRRAPCVYDGQ